MSDRLTHQFERTPPENLLTCRFCGGVSLVKDLEENKKLDCQILLRCRDSLDPIFMEHGTEITLLAIGHWLKTADMAAGGHVGRLTGQIIENLSEWGR